MPLFLDPNGQARPLQRVDLNDRQINEGTLQDILHRHPSLLPVEEIDPTFGPVVSLGREILGIDNLFLSPNGRITLVETKLWRNPQATREVVAQILEYASRLAALDPDSLAQVCQNARHPTLAKGQSLHAFAAEHFTGVDAPPPEHAFHDNLARTLRHARFLLLIVGDGIREGLEDILGLIHQSPQRRFTIGLVEIQIHLCDNPPGKLIIPRVITRTREIIRAVVKVEHPADVNVTVTLPLPDKDKDNELTIDEFLEVVVTPEARPIVKRLVDVGQEIGRVGQVSKSLECRVPVNDCNDDLQLYRFGSRGGIWIANVYRQLRRRSKDGSAGEEFLESFLKIFAGLKPKATERRPDRPLDPLPRFLKAHQIQPVLPQLEQLLRDTAARLNEVGPGASPEIDENEEDEGAEA